MDRTMLDQRVYAIINAAAERNEPCPTGRAIGDAVNVSERVARDSIKRLQAQGRVAIAAQVGCNRRVVTIVETGKSTAPETIQSPNYVMDRPVQAMGDDFNEAMRRCGGRFEDHPRTKRSRRPAVFVPASLTQFSECGISTVYGL